MVIVGLGDHALTVTLSAVTLFFYFHFLVQVANLRPTQAAWVVGLGRLADAFTDPLMGRLSDRTRARAGRRRPYLLWGAVPLALSFVALWVELGPVGEALRFWYYAVAYVVFSLCYTLVAVPYTALLPELADDYQERTALNTVRSVMTLLGTLLAALAMLPLARSLGGHGHGFLAAASVLAIWVAWPWFAIFFATRERSDFQTPTRLSLGQGLVQMSGHGNFRALCGLYVCARSAIDVAGSLLLIYVSAWLQLERSFHLFFGAIMVAALATLPLWLLLSRRVDKRSVFMLGAAAWLIGQGALLTVQPSWPLAGVLGVCLLIGVGYGVVDMIPWSMIGEVIDEDELRNGERREGLYSGVFTFLRKLGGWLGVLLASYVLELAGWSRGDSMSDAGPAAVRLVMSLGPAVLLCAAILLAIPYSITRSEHARIVTTLQERRAAAGEGD